jgi:predicted lipid carrier protein YhbT
MHRADMESVSSAPSAFAADQAVDGIEELLFGFMARPGQRLRSEQPRTLLLEAIDTPAQWLIRIGPEEPSATTQVEDADCRVSATASDLFLLLWNRRAPDGLHVVGDSKLLDLWRQSVFVRWR